MAKRTTLLLPALLALTCLPAGAARADCAMPGVESAACPSLVGLGAGSVVRAISADGHTLVGDENALPARWVDGVAASLGLLPWNTTQGLATTVTADGSYVMGQLTLYPGPEPDLYVAFAWTPEHGLEVDEMPVRWPLPEAVSEDRRVLAVAEDWDRAAVLLDGVERVYLNAVDGSRAAYTHAVSADGSRIVGDAHDDSVFRAVLWQRSGTSYSPINLMSAWNDVGDYSEGGANAISPDGSIVVGAAGVRGVSRALPVRWDGLEHTFLPIGAFKGGAVADLAADGSLLVGSVCAAVNGTDCSAALWRGNESLELLADRLDGLGLDITGWNMMHAGLVSDDGWTVAGNGTYDGVPESFVAVLTPRVGLDIQPGSASNFVVLKPNGSLSVVLYGSGQLHVPTLNLAHVHFGPAHAPVTGGYLPQDMNGDGHPDLVLFFATEATGLAIGDTAACLEADGAQPFRVCGPVVVTTGNCGLGFEAGLALLPLMLWRRRLRRAR